MEVEIKNIRNSDEFTIYCVILRSGSMTASVIT